MTFYSLLYYSVLSYGAPSNRTVFPICLPVMSKTLTNFVKLISPGMLYVVFFFYWDYTGILKWPKSKMWSCAWNKAHFKNRLANTYQASTVSRVMIKGPWVQPPLGKIFDDFFCSSLCKDLSDNLTETPIPARQICRNSWKLSKSNRHP